MSDYYTETEVSLWLSIYKPDFQDKTWSAVRGGDGGGGRGRGLGGQTGKVSLIELQLYICNLRMMNNAASCILNQRSVQFLSGDICTDLTAYGFIFQFFYFFLLRL